MKAYAIENRQCLQTKRDSSFSGRMMHYATLIESIGKGKRIDKSGQQTARTNERTGPGPHTVSQVDAHSVTYTGSRIFAHASGWL